jgi:O-antigen ligase
MGPVAEGVSAPLRDVTFRWRVGDALRALQVYGLALLLIFAVLAFGAVENWSLFVMSVTAVVLLGCWCAEQMLRDRLELTVSAIFMPLAGFGAILAAQYASRATTYLYATQQSLLTAAILGVVFFLASQALTSHHDVDRFTTVMTVFGFLLAFFAIVQYFTSPHRIYWTIRPPDAGLVFGPYVNRNHFAGIMELLMPLALVNTFDEHRPTNTRALFGFMSALMVSSVVLSRSRAGIIALAAESIFFYVLFSPAKRRYFTIAIPLILALALILGVWLGGGGTLERFASVDNTRARIALDSLRMVPRHPWLGWGAGTFESVYPRFRGYTSQFAVDHAHNDYLEALVETGVAGLTMITAFVFLFYRTAWKSLATRTWSRTGPRVATLVGCTGLLVHSFADFNMHIPANAATFLVMAAIAVNTSAAKYAGSSRQIHWERRV